MFRSIEAVLQRLHEAVVITDEFGTVLWGNDKMVELVGGDVDGWVGQSILDALHPDSITRILDSIESMFDRDVDNSGALLRFRLKMAGGGYGEFESRGCWLEVDEGKVLVNVLRNMEDRFASDVHGGDNQRLLALVDHSPSILALLDDERRVISVSNAASRLLGRDVVHTQGVPFVELVAEHHRDLFDTAMDEIDVNVHLTLDLPASSGNVLHFDAHITDLRADASVGAYVATLTDVSELKVAEHRLRHIADHDSLTGALTRRAFTDALDAALGRSDDVALLFLDLDKFKAVNDTHGHLAGDAVLVEFGSRLKDIVRGADLVGRLGGDEFAVALIGDSKAGSVAISRRIAEAVECPVDVGGRHVSIGVSIGAAFADQVPTASGLLRLADERMYDHKAARHAAATESPSPRLGSAA